MFNFVLDADTTPLVEESGDLILNKRLYFSLFEDMDSEKDIVDISYNMRYGTKYIEGWTFVPHQYLYNMGDFFTVDQYYDCYYSFVLKNISPKFPLEYFGSNVNHLLCTDCRKQLISLSRWCHIFGVPHQIRNLNNVFSKIEKRELEIQVDKKENKELQISFLDSLF